MARYTGPKHRLARRVGVNILDKTSNSLARRLSVPPGIHGRKRKRRLSEFGQQLMEKQKAKFTYGIMEKQFKNLVEKVSKRKGDTQEFMISLLERRLDNMVYRLGFAKTRNMARQLVSHGHVLVNGKKTSIPSYEVSEGDIITLSKSAQGNVGVLNALKEEKELLPFVKREGLTGKLLRHPKGGDLQMPFNLRQIIEYYSR
ncbi:MAG TPA: 30S ribosomal protein S4 [Patescibacteria group bacterium]|nr:30S ribosomal protein S4 [Patescibacteria group bacterium]